MNSLHDIVMMSLLQTYGNFKNFYIIGTMHVCVYNSIQHLCVLMKDLLQCVVWFLQQVSEVGFPMSNTRAGNAMEQELGDQLGRLLGAIN